MAYRLHQAGTSHIRVIQMTPSNLHLEAIQNEVLRLHLSIGNAGYQDRKLVFFSEQHAGIDFVFIQLDQ